jgi:hypothetical protein
VAQRPIKKLYVGVSFILAVTCMWCYVVLCNVTSRPVPSPLTVGMVRVDLC